MSLSLSGVSSLDLGSGEERAGVVLLAVEKTGVGEAANAGRRAHNHFLQGNGSSGEKEHQPLVATHRKIHGTRVGAVAEEAGGDACGAGAQAADFHASLRVRHPADVGPLDQHLRAAQCRARFGGADLDDQSAGILLGRQQRRHENEQREQKHAPQHGLPANAEVCGHTGKLLPT